MHDDWPSLRDHILSSYDEAFAAYDHNRLGGTMGETPEENYLVATRDDIAAVHVFANTVVVVGRSGSVMVIDRHNGQLKAI